MFDLNTIKVLHIEPTTVCQAACPQCARENPLLYTKINQCELTLTRIKQLVPESVIKNLNKMFMCGNFGEPTVAKHCLEIYQYFKDLNPSITLGLNTNGGTKTPDWWASLAETFNSHFDYVVFSIDGLEDTNHLYRRNVKWKRVMENAQAFIDAGGSAHWDMLIFRHNQHQVEQAQNIAKNIGFSWFRAKVSKRFETIPVENLNPPAGYELPNVHNPSSIDCHALNEQSLFLAANGEFLPCCFMGTRIFNRDVVVDQALSTKNFKGVVESWKNNPLPICSKTCGTNKLMSKSSFENQWHIEVNLHE